MTLFAAACNGGETQCVAHETADESDGNLTHESGDEEVMQLEFGHCVVCEERSTTEIREIKYLRGTC